MAGCEWREEPDGFRYLEVVYTGADESLKYELFRLSADELAGVEEPRTLVDVCGTEFDPMWFKQVKERSKNASSRRVRLAILVEGKASAARVHMLDYIGGGADRIRPFTDHDEAVAWLRDG